MTKFLHGHHVAPRVIAYESGPDGDDLLTEAVSGEDGTSARHLGNPGKLAGVFGEYLNLLHSLPPGGCPYANRTHELLDAFLDAYGRHFIDDEGLRYFATDPVDGTGRQRGITWKPPSAPERR